jgi:hypothetical protein
MEDLPTIEGYEISAWCAICKAPLRVHEKNDLTKRREEWDPGYSTEHIVFCGVSLCVGCLKKFMFREYMLGSLSGNLQQHLFSLN